jgi:pimeloyl-ACP methyl ester carboxylesterase
VTLLLQRFFGLALRLVLVPGISLLAAMSWMPASAQAADLAPRPIVFVHGNGDSAALWLTTVWRFESNGYDPALLFALDFPHPTAPSDNTKPTPNRSTADDQLRELSAQMRRILGASTQGKAVLIGSSRGGNTIRNYVKNGGGAAHVSLVILGGATNHGVFALPVNLNSEFNGSGPFLTQLNAGSEVVPGVEYVTLRSDRLDKYAQPTGEFLGMPGKPTNIGYDAPELKGARNIVLDGLDHREVAFHKRAFREMYLAVTGREPVTLDVKPQERPVLNGIVSGFEAGAPTNLPLVGATVNVYEVDPATGERKGAAVHNAQVGPTGQWGPFTASPTAYYEWEISAAGYPTTHVYRTPFPRSSRYVHYRLAPEDKKLEGAGSVVMLARPRGYLGHGRDTFTLDGVAPDGVNPGVPGTATGVKTYPAGASRAVPAMLNGERMTVRTWPLAEGHLTIAEFHD